MQRIALELRPAYDEAEIRAMVAARSASCVPWAGNGERTWRLLEVDERCRSAGAELRIGATTAAQFGLAGDT